MGASVSLRLSSSTQNGIEPCRIAALRVLWQWPNKKGVCIKWHIPFAFFSLFKNGEVKIFSGAGGLAPVGIGGHDSHICKAFFRAGELVQGEGVARAVERMLLRLAKQAPAIVCAQQADCSVPRGVAAFYAFKHGVGWHSAGKQFGAAFVGRHNHINRQGVVVGVGQANVRIVKRLNALLSQRRPAVACRANAAVRIAVAADWAGLRGGSASCQGSGKR